MLLDQHDFLVVGVLGTQSVGKSTVMSALAGGDHAKYVFVLLQREMGIIRTRYFLLRLSLMNHPSLCLCCWLGISIGIGIKKSNPTMPVAFSQTFGACGLVS